MAISSPYDRLSAVLSTWVKGDRSLQGLIAFVWLCASAEIMKDHLFRLCFPEMALQTFLGGVFPSLAAFLASVLCSPLFSPYSLQNRSAIACRIAGVDEGRRHGKPIATSYSPSPDHVGGRPSFYSSCES